MAEPIALFQTERCWSEIREQVLDLVDQEHRAGKAQNGQLVHDLEQRLARMFDRRFCLTVANCTDALTLSMMALDLPAHSRVAVSDYTFIASASAISAAGHVAVPVEVDQDYCVHQWPTDVDAVVAVDIFGNMCTVPDTSIPVIVDSAQSLESHDGDHWSAGRGVFSCLSFSPSKTISAWGSGGAILTDDPALYTKARQLRLYGRDDHGNIVRPGLNSMMSSFEAACVWAGLDHRDQWWARRDHITRYLVANSRLGTGLDMCLSQHTFHKLVFRTPQRDLVMQDFKSKGIQTVVHYPRTVHQHQWCAHGTCPTSAALATQSFTVPNQHTLTDNEVERILEALT